MTLRAEFIIQTVLNALDVLCRENDLSPHNQTINSTLTDLVQTLSGSYAALTEDEVLNDPRVIAAKPQLIEKLSLAEGAMEKYWSDVFLQSDTLDTEDLKKFWYWNCYENLLEKELDCLPPEMKSSDREAVFIGAGALPLTAIILHQKTGMRITCVDSDPAACERATKLFTKLGMNDFRVICAAGEDIHYNDINTVFIASLVPQPAKEKIIGEIRNSNAAIFIAVRSAEKLHSLLYEPLDEQGENISQCLFVGRTQHDHEAINTTLVYYSPAGRGGPHC